MSLVRNDRPTTGVPRFHSLEGLRAWMAWWVVLGHLANVSGLPKLLPGYFSPLFNGSVAVNVFIIVSGFVITHLLLVERTSYGAFIARRALRLWPAYALGLAVMVGFSQAYKYAYIDLPWHVTNAENRVAYESVHDNLAPHLALHASLLQGIVPNEILLHADSSLLSPAWSLSLEWQFYLIAPLLAAFAFASRRRLALVSVAAVVASCAMLIQPWATWDFPAFLLVSGPFFLVGIASRLYMARIAQVLNKKLSIAAQVLAVLLALALVDALTTVTLGRN